MSMAWFTSPSARDPLSGELWYIVSDEPTTLQTFAEYAERFDIEEEFFVTGSEMIFWL